jgi:hypothetical protein
MATISEQEYLAPLCGTIDVAPPFSTMLPMVPTTWPAIFPQTFCAKAPRSIVSKTKTIMNPANKFVAASFIASSYENC